MYAYVMRYIEYSRWIKQRLDVHLRNIYLTTCAAVDNIAPCFLVLCFLPITSADKLRYGAWQGGYGKRRKTATEMKVIDSRHRNYATFTGALKKAL